MKRAIIFILILVLAGCQTQIVCNKPYILVGTSCCLDQNDNLICDEDEQKLGLLENKADSVSGNVVLEAKSREQFLDERLAEINNNIAASNPNIAASNITTNSSENSSSSSSSSSAPQPETPPASETPQEQTSSGDPECVALGCPDGTNYVGSINSDKYHKCSCRWAHEDQGGIKKENLNCFKDKSDAESQEYIPCSVCDP